MCWAHRRDSRAGSGPRKHCRAFAVPPTVPLTPEKGPGEGGVLRPRQMQSGGGGVGEALGRDLSPPHSGTLHLNPTWDHFTGPRTSSLLVGCRTGIGHLWEACLEEAGGKPSFRGALHSLAVWRPPFLLQLQPPVALGFFPLFSRSPLFLLFLAAETKQGSRKPHVIRISCPGLAIPPEPLSLHAGGSHRAEAELSSDRLGHRCCLNKKHAREPTRELREPEPGSSHPAAPASWVSGPWVRELAEPGRQADPWAARRMSGWVDRWTDGRVDAGWVGRWTEVQTAGWTHTQDQTEGQINAWGLKGGDEDLRDPI